MNATPKKQIDLTAEASEALLLRDQIAIAAMRGIVSTYSNGCGPKGGFPLIAIGAYQLADAMLAARAGTIDIPAALKAKISPRKEDEE